MTAKFANIRLASNDTIKFKFLLCAYNADVLSQHFNYGNSALAVDCMPFIRNGTQKAVRPLPTCLGQVQNSGFAAWRGYEKNSYLSDQTIGIRWLLFSSA